MEDSAYCVVDRCSLSYISHFTRHYEPGQVEHGRDTINFLTRTKTVTARAIEPAESKIQLHFSTR